MRGSACSLTCIKAINGSTVVLTVSPASLPPLITCNFAFWQHRTACNSPNIRGGSIPLYFCVTTKNSGPEVFFPPFFLLRLLLTNSNSCEMNELRCHFPLQKLSRNLGKMKSSYKLVSISVIALTAFYGHYLFMSWSYLSFHSVWNALTDYHRLRGWNNRRLFLTVVEAGSPRSRCRPVQFLAKTLSRFADAVSLHNRDHLCYVFSYEDTNPIHKGSKQWTSIPWPCYYPDPIPNLSIRGWHKYWIHSTQKGLCLIYFDIFNR